MATLGLDAELGQHAQAGQRRGGDGRLGDRRCRRSSPAGGRAGLCTAPDRREAAAQGAAVEVGADPGRGRGSRSRRAGRRGQGRRPARDPAGYAAPSRSQPASVAQPLRAAPRGSGGHHGRPAPGPRQVARQQPAPGRPARRGTGAGRRRQPLDLVAQATVSSGRRAGAARRPAPSEAAARARAAAERRPPRWCGSLEHDVGVDAAEAHGADAGAQRAGRPARARPRRATRRAGAAPVSSGWGSSQPVVGGRIWALDGERRP